MLNICALVQRIPAAKNQSAQFRCVPVFFVQKRESQLLQLLLRRRSFLFLLLLFLLFSSFATEVPSTRTQVRFPPLSPVRAWVHFRAAAGNQVNTWYDVRSCTKSNNYFSWLPKHFFASKIVLQVIVCCLRGVGSMSSSRRVPRSFHRTVFFGAPLAFLRVVKCFLSLYPFPQDVAMGLIRGCVIFMFFLLRFFFLSTELQKRQP